MESTLQEFSQRLSLPSCRGGDEDTPPPSSETLDGPLNQNPPPSPPDPDPPSSDGNPESLPPPIQNPTSSSVGTTSRRRRRSMCDPPSESNANSQRKRKSLCADDDPKPDFAKAPDPEANTSSSSSSVPSTPSKDPVWSTLLLQKQLTLEFNPICAVSYGSSTCYCEMQVGVAFGGKALNQGLHAFNVIELEPLRFGKCNDPDIFKAVERINWEKYNINPHMDRVSVFVKLMRFFKPEQDHTVSILEDSIKECCKSVQKILKKPIEEQERIKESARKYRNLSRNNGMPKKSAPPRKPFGEVIHSILNRRGIVRRVDDGDGDDDDDV